MACLFRASGSPDAAPLKPILGARELKTGGPSAVDLTSFVPAGSGSASTLM